MKKKIVLWGSDENDNKLLLALELMTKENTVKILSFPENVATEEFYNKMMDDWRVDKEVEFPEGYTTLDRPLSVTEDILPETIKVDRSDVINRAKTEWHFVVLSSKLYELYKSELEEFKERIARLSEFDSNVFDELKSFWSKVSDQAREKNLFRDHADKLKESTNELFGKLKEFRSKANEELKKISEENVKAFTSELDKIDEKMEKGLGLKPIFEELKELQNRFKSTKFTRDDRSGMWEKIDGAFKKFKEKKYGDNATNGNRSSRLDRRYQGLLSAIDKMEKSIARDQKDIDFQNKRVDQTQGQLEMQIRQAKVKMVQERIDSKREKLNDMLATKKELESKLSKEEEKQKIREKEQALKAKIASEINEKAQSEDVDAEKLKEAAQAINKSPGQTEAPKKESLIEKLKTEVSEMVEDVVDTVKAVSEVIEENVEDKVEKIVDSAKAKAEEMKLEEKLKEVKHKAEELKDTVEDKIEEIVESVKGEEE